MHKSDQGGGEGMRRGREGKENRKRAHPGKSPTPPSPLTTDHPQDSHSPSPHTPAIKEGQNDDKDDVVVVWGARMPCMQVSPPPHHLHSPLTTDHPQDPYSPSPQTPAVKDSKSDDDDAVVVVWVARKPRRQVSPPSCLRVRSIDSPLQVRK
jgi:hypothetical protein